MKNLLMILIIFGMTIGCKTTEKTTTRTISINDTLIHHRVESIVLPTRNITVIEKPCRKDTIKIFQQVQVGNSTVIVKSDSQNNLIIDVKTDSLISVIDSLRTAKEERISEKVEVVKTKYRVPKIMWWILAILLILVIWSYRKIFLKLIGI